ncbi:MAG: glycosyl hydrolase family protein [Spirochaetaceae bacterium]|nr:MAG: glycosyl hydrolase family protein [Spirochaetaceae bacterium]
MSEQSPFSLPDDFLFGTATAATQIEGGDTRSNWYHWAMAGNTKDGAGPETACDHWNRWQEDLSLITSLNSHSYRLGLDWARMEPAPGVFDDAAFDHYREELKALREAGVEPLVTLYHFAHPQWFEEAGGWPRPGAGADWLRFVSRVLDDLGDLVTDWITINEPNVYLIFAHVFGEWPPGDRNILRFFRGARHMVQAHREAYARIHAYAARRSTPARVGVAHHLRVFDPLRPLMRDRFACSVTSYLSQDYFLKKMTGTNGRWADFLGVNYYSRDMVRFTADPASGFGVRSVAADAPVNDLGWEIYPDGLYRCVRSVHSRYRLPVYITENGTSDANDHFRIAYIYDHVREIARLIADGVPVTRYYHWSLLDNFEWAEGNGPRFGLYEVDYATQTRRPRNSARFYSELARERAVTRDMIETYLSY